jgi:hypothetical protein
MTNKSKSQIDQDIADDIAEAEDQSTMGAAGQKGSTVGQTAKGMGTAARRGEFGKAVQMGKDQYTHHGRGAAQRAFENLIGKSDDPIWNTTDPDVRNLGAIDRAALYGTGGYLAGKSINRLQEAIQARAQRAFGNRQVNRQAAFNTSRTARRAGAKETTGLFGNKKKGPGVDIKGQSKSLFGMPSANAPIKSKLPRRLGAGLGVLGFLQGMEPVGNAVGDSLPITR